MDDDLRVQSQLAQNDARALSYQTPSNQLGGSAVLMLTNPGEVTHDFELLLKGMEDGEDGKPIRVIDPLMNPMGCFLFMRLLKSLVNQINILGNISENEKIKIMEYNDEQIEALTCRWKFLGMTDNPEKRVLQTRMIAVMFTNLFYVVLNRPQDEGERHFLKGTQHEFSFNSQGAGAEKKGLAGIMSSLKRSI